MSVAVCGFTLNRAVQRSAYRNGLLSINKLWSSSSQHTSFNVQPWWWCWWWWVAFQVESSVHKGNNKEKTEPTENKRREQREMERERRKVHKDETTVPFCFWHGCWVSCGLGWLSWSTTRPACTWQISELSISAKPPSSGLCARRCQTLD